ncbi:RloB domain-containing protein [Sporolactobacillus nakayamae]|uniref:RloB domain-containing protein n=1 Tax=Sporolactobacillus nakayamae TaxID=269670 RepID=UPI003CCC1531
MFCIMNISIQVSQEKTILKKLVTYLEHPYRKNDPGMYQTLLEKGNQQQAIKKAERLLACYSPSNPVEDNPSTTVHELVKVLNQYKLKVQ